MSKIDRMGEENINTFGSNIVIVEYRKSKDIDVYFPKYNWITKGTQYINFKNGNVKCPYERRVYGIGYLGEGKYKSSKNGKPTKVYGVWNNMLERCYDKKYQQKHPTYKGCKVCDEWLNFQNFAKWFENNYYEIENERMHLDKDILVKHNKIYSPDTCIYVPQTVNSLFTKRDNDRGESIIGVSSYKNGKYRVQCSIINPETGKSKNKHLGYYETQEKAFEIYKYYKEKNIKEVADYFKGQISDRLYNALYSYEVEIDD